MSNLPLNSYQQVLNNWNTDKNDKGLTLKELKNAVDANHDNQISPQELKAKGLNDKQANELLNKVNNINASDKFFSSIGMKTNKDTQVVCSLFEMDEKALPGGISEVSVNDIQQGHRPTCYLLGATSALVHQRPQDILNLIEKNKDGTYTVTFPGLPETKKKSIPVGPMPTLPLFEPKIEIKNNNKVTVSAPTDEELKNFTHKGLNNSTWVAIVDKAYNKYCQENGIKANYIPFYPKDKASDYGMPWEGVEALTGNKTEHYMVDLTRDKTMLNDIKEALDDKRVVVACTIMKGDKHPKEGNLKVSNAHVFGVMDVNKEKKTITVRDPYGELKYLEKGGNVVTDRSTNGFMELSMEKFNKYFTDLVIEKNEPLNK